MAYFTHDRPVLGRGAYIGRETLVRSVIDGVHEGRSFALCGGPRTGKTSTLLHLRWTLHERWRRASRTTKVVPVIYDVATAASARDVPSAIWHAVTEAVRDPRVAGDSPPQIPDVDLRKVKDPWVGFREAAQLLWESLRGTSAWCQYALFIDGASALFDRKLGAALDPLAELVQVEEQWAPVAIVAAGGRYLHEHLLDHDGAFHFLRPLLLGALRDAEAEKLLRQGLPDAEPGLIAAIQSTSGGHPWAVQRIAAEIETRGDAIGVEGAVDAAAPDCLRLFEEIWNEIDLDRGVTYRGAYAAPEHALLQLILQAGHCEVKTAERELGIKPLREYAELLEYTGICERVLMGDASKLRPQFDLWNIWYGERIQR